ncbi:hypothetical protein CL647_04000 [bacterium]|nr:hypothetical protein [bacterium]
MSKVENLLARGADVNATDNGGNTALHWAVRNGWEDIVQLLLDKGAEVNAKDKYGNRALNLVAFYGSEDIVQALVKAGADVNAKDSEGLTALHYAGLWGFTDMVKALVIAGADVNATDNDGWTALQFAKKGGHYVSESLAFTKAKKAIEEGKNELIKLHQDALNKYPKKQDQLPKYIKFVLKQSLQGTSAVTRTIVQFIEKPLSESQKKQAKKYIEEREAAAATKIQKRINE